MPAHLRLRYQLDELSEKDSEVNAFMTDEKDWIDRECAIGMFPCDQQQIFMLMYTSRPDTAGGQCAFEDINEGLRQGQGP